MTSLYNFQRQGWRLECGDKCVLAHGEKSAECILVDISISGVLVSCSEGFAANIGFGDICRLHLCGDSQVCPSVIHCTVVRRDFDKIGLQFAIGN